MAAPLRLEVFDTAEPGEAPALLLPEEVADLRLTAFERGYVAGYDDAGRQAEAETRARHERLTARLEALAFGYHEARAHVLSALAPLLEAMVTTLLPAMARQAVVPLVLEQLLPLAATRAEAPLLVRVPPGWRGDYEAAFAGRPLPPLKLVETPELSDGMAEIVSETDETRVDLAAVVERIAAALAETHIRPTEECRRA